MPRIPSYLKTSLKIGLSLLSLWLVFRTIEPRQVGAVLEAAQPGWLLAATVLFIGSKVISAERLRSFFARIDLPLSVPYNLKLYWLGMYYNLFLPGGVGGDGYKVYLLNRLNGTPVKPLLSATLYDRVVGLLPLLYLLAVLAALLPQVPLPAAVWLATLPVIHFVGAWLTRRFLPRFYPVYHRAVGQSMGAQLCQAAEVLVLIRATGAAGAPEAYLLVFLVSSIVATIPFTIGGAGARELTFLVGAQTFGLPADAAVAVSLLFYLISVAVSLTGFVYSFRMTTP